MQPQIVYYVPHGFIVYVYCDINRKIEQITLEQFDELSKSIELLLSVGCNISLRSVQAIERGEGS